MLVSKAAFDASWHLEIRAKYLSTVKPLKTDKQKCPSYRGVRLIKVIFNRNRPLEHLKVSVLESCPSYGMSVLRGFTVILKDICCPKNSCFRLSVNCH